MRKGRFRILGLAALLLLGLGLSGCESGSGDAAEGTQFATRSGYLTNNGGNGGDFNGGGPNNPGPGNGSPVPFDPGDDPTTTPTPPPGGGGRIFITHFGSDTVGVYDATNYALIDEVTVGLNPRGLAYDTERARVIVTLDDGSVVTFSASDFNDMTSFTTPGTFPADVAYDPVNDAIFVPHRFGGQLSGVNAGNFASLANFPVSLVDLVEVRVDAAGQRAFSIENNGSNLFVVDIASGSHQAVLVNGGGNLDGLVYDASPERLFIGGFANGQLIVMDASTPTPSLLQSISTTGSQPTSVAVDTQNDRVYTANLGSSNVTVFDDSHATTDPLSFNQTLATGGPPIGVYFDEQRNRILTTNESSDSISVFDANGFSDLGDFPVGDGPYVILVEPDNP